MKRTNTAIWNATRNMWKINVQKDGKRKSFYSGTPGRTGQREANAKADAWLDDNIADAGSRIEYLYEKYVDELKIRTSSSNWRKVESQGRNWITPQIGMKKISSLTDQHLQDIINAAYAKGLSKKSLCNLRATLVAFIKYCRKCKVTTYHPEDIIIPKGATSVRKQILQPEHLITLFTVDTTVRANERVYDEYINAYRFQVLTGLRPGELLGLMWKDIKGNTVYISRSMNIYGETTKGKNENAIRSFALNELSEKVLDEQAERTTGSLVFGGRAERTYRDSWKRYCEANAIPYVTPYELRHTFVSIAKSLPEGHLKSLVGHSKSMDTYGIYSHAINGEQQETAIMLNELFCILLQEKKE